MSPRSLACSLSFCLGLLLCAVKPVVAGPEQISFSKDVAPILLKRCLGCHGPNEPKGQYRLHNYDVLLKAGESGEASVTPGKPDKSELYRLISSTDADERMPREGDPLTSEQVALVKRWIEQAAPFDGPDKLASLAALVPKKIHPPAPKSYRVPVPIAALAFRPDGKELAVGGYHEVTIWDPATGSLLRRIENVEQRTLALQYSPDGALLAVAGGTPGQSGEVSLFDPAQGTLVATLGQLSDVAFGVAFDSSGTRLAACAADRTIRIYDLKSRAEQRVIEDHADWVLGIAWNPDGTQLASASRDKTSKVFDAKTGESLATYPGHGDTVYAVAFNADGKSVYSAGADKRIHVWTAATGKQAAPVAGDRRRGVRTGAVRRPAVQRLRRPDCPRTQAWRIFRWREAMPATRITSTASASTSRPSGWRPAASTAKCGSGTWTMARMLMTFYAAPGYSAPAQTAKN